ncbi:MAG: hypothetical protein NZ551_02515 [Microscillaceae bacterium]|nr:hypothetical protein [Microscillaceae bacterium]MDW8460059.1 hypothetical protein [Cytophagales bacterium]
MPFSLPLKGQKGRAATGFASLPCFANASHPCRQSARPPHP